MKCDVCLAERGQVNHWYVVRANRSGLHFVKRRQEGDKDVCGHACAHRLLDRWLAGESAKRPAAGPPAAEGADEES